jgi:hypothetical protein
LADLSRLNPNSGVWNYMWMADPSLGRDKDPNRVSAYLMEGDVPVEFGEDDADAAATDAAAGPDRTTDFLDELASSRDWEAMLRANLQRGEGSGIDFADDVPWGDELSAALLRDAEEGLPRTMTEEAEHDEKKEKEIETEKESSTKKKYSMQELMELIAEGKTPEDVRQIDDKFAPISLLFILFY